jgi:PAS domain S-box-containing protein
MINYIIPRSLLAQMLLACGSIQILMLALVLWHNTMTYEREIDKYVDAQTQLIAPLLHATLSRFVFQRDYIAARTVLNSLSDGNLRFLEIYDAGGRRFMSLDDGKPVTDAVTESRSGNDRKVEMHSLRLGEETVGAFRFSLKSPMVPRWHTELFLLVVFATLLPALAVSLLGYHLIRRIRSLLHQTQLFSAGDFSVRFDDRGQDELHQLAVELNRMRATLRERSTALQLSEQRFRDFARSGSDWLWELDAELRLAWLSENFEQATGLSPEKVCGKPANYIDTEDNLADPDYQHYLSALQRHAPFKNVQVCRMTARGLKWRRLSGIPIFDEQGRFQGYRGVTADITELRESKHNAERQQQRFMEALELFDSMFALFDADNRLLLGNRKCQEFMQSQGIAHLFKTGTAFATMLDAQLERGLVSDALGCEQQWRQWRLAQLDQPAVSFDIQAAPGQWLHVRQQRLPDGCLLMLHVDISTRKRAEQMLEQAKRKAEQADAMKTRFLTTASHDLRQPLQGMRMLKDTLTLRMSDPAIAGLFDDWETTLNTMERLVNGYLDIGRLESGAITPKPDDFAVQSLLEPIYTEFAAPARDKGLELRLIACSAVIRSDRLLLRQILCNLVANAIRYTKTGKVLIGCRRRGGNLSVQVWDSGPGIGQDQQSKIFEEFYQVDNPARSSGGSYGLGLAIVNHTAHLLGHPVRVASVPGRGSMFAVEVPCRRSHLPAPIRIRAESRSNRKVVSAGRRLLIVEDDKITRRSLELLMRSRNFQITVCENSEQALKQLTQNALEPQLVITDLRLPGADSGLSWLRKLRQLLQPRIPVIVITGDISSDLHDAVEAMDCILLTKPVRAEKLLLLLEQQLNPRNHEVTRSGSYATIQ